MKLERITKKQIKAVASRGSFFTTALVELTSNCNFQCNHCYNDASLPDQPLNNVISLVEKLREIGVLFITLTGGEPLLSRNFEFAYRYLKEQGFLVAIYTNGSTIERYSELFQILKPINVSISIYGLSENDYLSFTGVPHQYTKVLNGISTLNSLSIDYELKVTVSKTNYFDILAGLYDNFAKKYGKMIFYSENIISTLHGDKSTQDIRVCDTDAAHFLKWDNSNKTPNFSYSSICNSSPKLFSCSAGKSSIYVNSHFDIGVCMKDLKHFYYFGFESKVLVKKLKERGRHIQLIANTSNCSECDINSRCLWCPVASEYEGIDFPDPFVCNVNHKFVELYLEEGNNAVK